jgi:hypothetical protein
VTVAGRSGVALAEAKLADKSLAGLVERELQTHALRIVLAAGKAEVLLHFGVACVVAVGVGLSGHEGFYREGRVKLPYEREIPESQAVV